MLCPTAILIQCWGIGALICLRGPVICSPCCGDGIFAVAVAKAGAVFSVCSSSFIGFCPSWHGGSGPRAATTVLRSWPVRPTDKPKQARTWVSDAHAFTSKAIGLGTVTLWECRLGMTASGLVSVVRLLVLICMSPPTTPKMACDGRPMGRATSSEHVTDVRFRLSLRRMHNGIVLQLCFAMIRGPMGPAVDLYPWTSLSYLWLQKTAWSPLHRCQMLGHLMNCLCLRHFLETISGVVMSPPQPDV